MVLRNLEIAEKFKELADFLEIDGQNPFRIRAYRNAARKIENLDVELFSEIELGADLTKISGIGKDLAEKISILVRTCALPVLEEIQIRIPREVGELLKLPGLGPKRVHVLFHELGITSLQKLEVAAREGRLEGLSGWGKKGVESLLKAIASRRDASHRHRSADVVRDLEALVKHLRNSDANARITPAGSFRRSRESVGDVDLLVASEEPKLLMDSLITFEDGMEILAHGISKSSVVLRNGIQVDLRVVDAKSYGSALHYFTGSKAHNIAVRQRAQHMGLKVSEYGVFDGDRRVGGESEEEVFAALELDWIPPELREGLGEVEAAEVHALPRLVKSSDIRGDLHTHSTATDGSHSILEMAEAARSVGYEYMAVTDHSKRLAVANGLDEDRLLLQLEEIDRVNSMVHGLRILKGIEVDILEDGRLDLSDEILGRLDLVVASVHHKFNLDREKQTDRVLRAMDHQHFSILAHPTGRLILSREPYEIDMPRVIKHARDRGCFLELNANPSRLDLNDKHCKLARDYGVLVSINTDAHRTRDFANIDYGVGQARRGWLERADVLNTRNLDELLVLLKGTMQ